MYMINRAIKDDDKLWEGFDGYIDLVGRVVPKKSSVYLGFPLKRKHKLSLRFDKWFNVGETGTKNLHN